MYFLWFRIFLMKMNVKRSTLPSIIKWKIKWKSWGLKQRCNIHKWLNRMIKSSWQVDWSTTYCFLNLPLLTYETHTKKEREKERDFQLIVFVKNTWRFICAKNYSPKSKASVQLKMCIFKLNFLITNLLVLYMSKAYI